MYVYTHIVVITVQSGMDVWTRTGGHLDECKYHFICGSMKLVHFNISLYSKDENHRIFLFVTQ